ncbi:TPA: Fic family protein, partial [Yersinia enterocolitica]
NRNDYYALLRGVTERGEWENWILYMLKAVAVTATWTTKKVAAVRGLIISTKEYIQENLPKIYTWELVNVLFMQPYCRIENLMDAGIAQRQTASQYLKQLVETGVLEEVRAGRSILYINTRLLRELND